MSHVEQLKIYDHLSILVSDEIWKDESYYEGHEDLLHLSKGTFAAFIKEVFNLTPIWFYGLKKILELENGEELFMQHGRENMITYYNSTSAERKKILEFAKQSPVTRSFASLRAQAFPSRKKEAGEIKNSWKVKYEKALERIYELEEEIKALQKTIQSLSKALEKAEEQKTGTDHKSAKRRK
jgi:hypothetical protein